MGFTGAAQGAEKVVLQLRFPTGETRVYENFWQFEYFSKRADLIDADKASGTVDVRIYGDWKSHEQARPIEPEAGEAVADGTIGFSATVRDAEAKMKLEFKRKLDEIVK